MKGFQVLRGFEFRDVQGMEGTALIIQYSIWYLLW